MYYVENPSVCHTAFSDMFTKCTWKFTCRTGKFERWVKNSTRNLPFSIYPPGIANPPSIKFNRLSRSFHLIATTAKCIFFLIVFVDPARMLSLFQNNGVNLISTLVDSENIIISGASAIKTVQMGDDAFAQIFEFVLLRCLWCDFTSILVTRKIITHQIGIEWKAFRIFTKLYLLLKF